jgi:hypothetical protein
MDDSNTNAAVREMKRQLGTGRHTQLDFGLVPKGILLTPLSLMYSQLHTLAPVFLRYPR